MQSEKDLQHNAAGPGNKQPAPGELNDANIGTELWNVFRQEFSKNLPQGGGDATMTVNHDGQERRVMALEPDYTVRLDGVTNPVPLTVATLKGLVTQLVRVAVPASVARAATATGAGGGQ